jgi:hypothetical protein
VGLPAAADGGVLGIMGGAEGFKRDARGLFGGRGVDGLEVGGDLLGLKNEARRNSVRVISWKNWNVAIDDGTGEIGSAFVARDLKGRPVGLHIANPRV